MEKMENQNQNPKQSNLPDLLEQKPNWILRHRVLYNVLAILVIVVVVGTFYLWQAWKANQNVNNQISDFFSSNQTDPTANWKTYTNSQYGFEFKYPSDLKAFDGKYPYAEGVGPIKIIDFVPIQGPRTFSLEVYDAKAVDLPSGRGTKVNNIEVYKYQTTLNGKTEDSWWFFDSQKKYFSRFLSDQNSDILFDQIFSTFKLIDNTLKTYTNSQYNFQFNYPGYITPVRLGDQLHTNITELQLGSGLSLFVFSENDLKNALAQEQDCTGMCVSNLISDTAWNHDLALFNQNKSGLLNCEYSSAFSTNFADYSCELQTVNEVKYLMIYNPGGGPYGAPTKTYITYHNGVRFEFRKNNDITLVAGIYQIRKDFEADEKTDNNTPVLNQILSTFKFTN